MVPTAPGQRFHLMRPLDGPACRLACSSVAYPSPLRCDWQSTCLRDAQHTTVFARLATASACTLNCARPSRLGLKAKRYSLCQSEVRQLCEAHYALAQVRHADSARSAKHGYGARTKGQSGMTVNKSRSALILPTCCIVTHEDEYDCTVVAQTLDMRLVELVIDRVNMLVEAPSACKVVWGVVLWAA